MTQYKENKCSHCKKQVIYNPWLTYQEKGDPVCKFCIEKSINQMRKAMGRFPIPIHPKSYGESYE